jgi:adenine-specific DNA-methyltransferase
MGGGDAALSMDVQLDWKDKPKHVERLSLPFQTVETINESRATRQRDRDSLFAPDGSRSSWRNLLIWGDNKLVMSSLLKEYAGEVKLIYIDPPFLTGEDFSMRVQVGDTNVVKQASILEEHAYRDTWGAGRPSYLRMLYERISLINELLAEDGRLFLHIGPNVSHYVKVLTDEIFGPENYVNEIVWQRTLSKSLMSVRLPSNHDVIFVYRKSSAATWNEEAVFEPYDPENLDEKTAGKYTQRDPDGRLYQLSDLSNPNPNRPNLTYEFMGVKKVWRWSKERMQAAYEAGLIVQPSPGAVPRLKRYLDEQRGRPLGDVWTDIPPINSQAKERLGYDTQKPEAILERVITLASDPGDLIADFFLGSGTTAAVAEKLGRRWIGCDLGRFAIQTTRKRLLNIPDCRPFDIRNLGSYERQHWQQQTGNGAVGDYLDTILALYRAEPVNGFLNLHGRKAGRMVHVGATDAPITIDEADDVMDEMADNGIESSDLLGWEWEMGLHDTIGERARRRGLDLRPVQIPREVMERRVQDADAVRFFELAYVDLDVQRNGREVSVVLKDFIIPDEDLIPPDVRDQIAGWSDLIDYWSVDFDYRDDTFHNQWQAYRTREDPVLATKSDPHEYPESGRHGLVIKIIDIFGNDTTKLAEVHIK